ncbi:hypothetical protein AALA22_15925 [Anaerovoracaceae bacterium 41-7]
MLNINDRVMINIPETMCTVKNAKALRKFNHRVSKITEIVSDGSYRLDIDGGKYVWSKTILAVPMARA